MTGRAAGAFVRARHAGLGRAFGSTTMAVYVVVLLTIFLTPLIVNFVGITLTHPLLTGALSSPRLPDGLVVAAGLVTACSLVVGTVRGPVAPGQFEASVRLLSPDPRRSTLGPPAWRTLTATALGCAAVGLVLGTAGAMSLGWPVAAAAWTTAGGLGCGIAIGNARLLGQAGIPRLTNGFAAILSAAAVFAAVSGGASDLGVVVLLAALALSTPWLVPFCLVRMRTGTVHRHAARAEVTASLTATGDWAAATREYRPQPRAGRHIGVLPRRLAAALPRTAWGIFLSAWRAPVRAATGLALIAVGALTLGVAFSLALSRPVFHSAADPSPFVLPAGSRVDILIVAVVVAAGCSLLHWGLGAFAESLEFAAETVASPALFRLTASQMLARTGAQFTVLVLMLGLPLIAAAGAVISGSVDLDGALPMAGRLGGSLWDDAGTPLTLGAILVLGLIQLAAAHIHAATKGPLPPVLTTPINSPMGDVSVLFILLWQLESIVLGPLLASLLGTLALVDQWWMIASAAAIGYLIVGGRRRLSSTRGR